MNEKDKQEMNEDNFNIHVFERTVKKAKRTSLIKTAVISIIAMSVVIFGLKLLNDWVIQKKIDSWGREERILFQEPNTSIWGTSYSYDFFKATAKTTIMKEVGGRMIPWDTIETNIYSFKKPHVVAGPSMSGGSYNEKEGRWDLIHHGNGERLVSFYHPKVKHNQLPNDLSLLKELREDQLVELGVSFDRAYTPKEVERFFAKEHVNWLWIDTAKEEDIKAYNDRMTDDEKHMSSGGYFGRYGAHPDALTSFYFHLTEWIEIQPQNKMVADLLDEVVDEQGNYDIERFRIIGAIISGPPSELQQYENKPFIRAVKLGATIDKY